MLFNELCVVFALEAIDFILEFTDANAAAITSAPAAPVNIPAPNARIPTLAAAALAENATTDADKTSNVADNPVDAPINVINAADTSRAPDATSGKTAPVVVNAAAVIVNPANPEHDLDVATIAAIYTGEITNWSEVGGNDSEIVLIGREANSGTRDGFESITDTEDACKYRQELTSTGDVITAVASNPSAIGYASVASLKDSVKALTVAGVAANEENIKNGSYVIQRPFVLVTKADTTLSETAQKFFDYATSAEANDLIIKAGVVPAN